MGRVSSDSEVFQEYLPNFLNAKFLSLKFPTWV